MALCSSYNFSEQNVSLNSFCSTDQCLAQLPRWTVHTAQEEKPDTALLVESKNPVGLLQMETVTG